MTQVTKAPRARQSWRIMLRRAIVVVAFAISLVGLASPAYAQQQGLVNIEIGDITLFENVSIAAAAAICDVQVQVLVADLRDDDTANCPAIAGAQVVR